MSRSCINNGEVTIQAEIAEEVTAKQTKKGSMACYHATILGFRLVLDVIR